MSTLKHVEDYIEDARTLLLDETEPFRYDDPSLLRAFNMTLLRARALRPDLFVYKYGDDVPSYSAIDSTDVCIEPQFRLALVYGLMGHALARDEEDVQDARAETFMETFEMMLTGMRPPRIRGGSNPGNVKKQQTQ